MMTLTVLEDGPLRFNEIKRQLEGISQKALTQCLRRLQRNGSYRLSEDRLTHMEDAQTLVRTALLLEREARMMQMASEPAEMQSHYNRILAHLDEMDNLVSNLGRAGINISVLAFQHTAQLFRGSIHILAKLHDQALNTEIDCL